MKRDVETGEQWKARLIARFDTRVAMARAAIARLPDDERREANIKFAAAMLAGLDRVRDVIEEAEARNPEVH